MEIKGKRESIPESRPIEMIQPDKQKGKRFRWGNKDCGIKKNLTFMSLKF